ncbi:MAG: polysaccharide deacetylase [Clostridiales bacterium]|nr:polysaccharide deacetylase [Clostridiales bacterium]
MNNFEEKRRTRIMRERRRKRRIRLTLAFIILVAVIVLICLAVSAIRKNNTQNADNQTAQISVTQEPVVYDEPAAVDYGIPDTLEENNIMEILQNSGQQKTAYLTFDDGPTTNITPQVLDVLRRYNVNATFFMVGSLIDANPDMARRVYEDGNLIADHSYAHNYAKLYENTESFLEEINKCYDTLQTVIDSDDDLFRLIRFPGGSFNSSADSYAPVKQDCKTALAQEGYYYCDWNSLNGDAEGKTKNAQELLEYFKNSAQGYNNLVILMHDAATKQATVDALPSIIEYLLNEGYTFKTLDDIDYNAQPVQVQ